MTPRVAMVAPPRGTLGRLFGPGDQGYGDVVVVLDGWAPGFDTYFVAPPLRVPHEALGRSLVFLPEFRMDDGLRGQLMQAAGIVAHCKAMLPWLARHGIDVPARAVSPGFDSKPQGRSQLTERVAERFTVGVYGNEAVRPGLQDCAGRSIGQLPAKGGDRVVEVARRLGDLDLRWRIGGRGWGPLGDALATLGYAIELDQGAQPSYGELDCLLIASRSEGGPLEALGALAAGVSVVSTPVGEMPELPVLLWEREEEAAGHVRELVEERRRGVDRREELRRAVRGRTRSAFMRSVLDLAADVATSSARSTSVPPKPRPDRVAPRFGSALVSVLMTAYRTPRWVGEAIRSVLRQRLPAGWRLELLVAVDGCAESLRVVQAVDDERLVLVELERNGGTYRALNTLLRYARGDVIAVHDSDDVAAQGRLHGPLQYLQHEPGVDLVGAQYVRTDEAGTHLGPPSSLPFDVSGAYQRGAISPVCHGTLTARRRVYDAVGGYDDTRLGGDWELVLRALALGVSGVNLPEVLLLRRQHPGQLTAAAETGVGSPARARYGARLEAQRAAYCSGDARPARLGTPATTAVRRVRGATRPSRVGIEPSRRLGRTVLVMATVPRRQETAGAVLAALLPQGLDRVVVHLNGHGCSDGWPRDDRIRYVVHPAGTGPIVRFEEPVELIDADDVVLTVDDDIAYPDDYVEVCRAHLRKLGPCAAVSFHGRYWPAGGGRYRERRVVHFTAGSDDDIVVPYVGSGVLALRGVHYGLLGGRPPPVFEHNDDVWVSAMLQATGVRLVRPACAAGWLRGLPVEGDSLYDRAERDGFADRELALRYAQGVLGWRLHDRERLLREPPLREPPLREPL